MVEEVAEAEAGVVVVVEEEEEEVWCEERQGREGEVSRLLQCAGGDSVKCRAKASQSVPA